MDKYTGMYQDITYQFEFKDSLNILYGDSGSGKSFLLNIAECCFQDHDIAYARLDYKYADAGVTDVVACCRGKRVVLIDNADIFFTTEMLQELQKMNLVIIIAMHEWEYLQFSSAGFYRVFYSDKQITCKRMGIAIE